MSELFEQFVIDEIEERQHGKTEPILKKEIRQVFRNYGLFGERVVFRSKTNRLTLRGQRARHSFDMKVRVNNHTEYAECISFDVENYAAKLDAAKVLVYDANDIRSQHRGVGIFSILYPPQSQTGTEPQKAFNEAKSILNEEGVEAFNFASNQDKGRLLERVGVEA